MSDTITTTLTTISGGVIAVLSFLGGVGVAIYRFLARIDKLEIDVAELKADQTEQNKTIIGRLDRLDGRIDKVLELLVAKGDGAK